jgi:hypothetical protein
MWRSGRRGLGRLGGSPDDGRLIYLTSHNYGKHRLVWSLVSGMNIYNMDMCLFVLRAFVSHLTQRIDARLVFCKSKRTLV